ncbi:MAG: glutathione S-transferase family protein [Alphaproteobacteria bacterium]|nr:MAG: glutathione S-transferase family protein [Alphaproteobacteria bacterium]
MDLYWMSGSPFAWRVTLALAIKKVDYVGHEIHGSKGDNKTPEFLAMNPRGKVPVLKDGDFVLYESDAILNYLERKYPEPSLTGKSPEEAGHIWQRTLEIESYLAPHLGLFGRYLFRGDKTVTMEMLAEAASAISTEFTTAAGWLEGQDWLAGNTVSMADIVLYPIAALVQRLGKHPQAAALPFTVLPFGEKLPALAAWMARIEALPGYDATYPPHWRT